jgi:iron complex outermembrane receptor protein
VKSATRTAHPSVRHSRRLAVAIAVTLAACGARAGGNDLADLDLVTLMTMDVTLVTAQKRTENVNEVPISMIVLKSADLSRHVLNSTVDLQAAAPGLSTSTELDFVMPYIRGIGTDNISSIESSVSIYVDGVYRADRSQTSVDLFDAEQIEILKGPQGTLYGRNSTGGAIKITTRGPTARPEASAQVSSGNLHMKDARLRVSGPLHERVRASFAAHTRQKDSYYENVLGLDENKSEDFYSLHGRVQVDVTDRLGAELLVKYLSRQDGSLQPTEISGNSLPALMGIPVATKPFESASDISPVPVRIVGKNAALKLDWSGEHVRAQSISAYDEVFYRTRFDLDASAASLASMDSYTPSRTFTQELQLTPARTPERVDWLAGVFYMHGTASLAPAISRATVPGVGDIENVYWSDNRTDAIAAFGETTFNLGGGYALTTGVRYSHEEKAAANLALRTQGMLIEQPDHSRDWDNMSYRVVAKYSTAQSLVYAKTETAFKTGSFNVLSPSIGAPTKAENITAYELGVKHSLAKLPVRVAAAAFFNDYRDQQLQLVDPDSQSALFGAAPKAETRGVDLSLDARVTKHWSVAAGLEWLDATYREFVADGVLVPSPMGGHTVSMDVDLAGKRMPRAPKLTANAAVSFDYPLLSGNVFGAANYYHSSRMYFDTANQYSQSSFETVNLRAGFRRNGWQISAWAKNVTDDVHLSGFLVTPVNASGWYAEPRTYGLTFEYAWR